MSLSFTVLGVAAPQGSFRAFVSKSTGRAFMQQSCKRTMPWRQEVAAAADKERHLSAETWPTKCAVELRVVFLMPRPKFHFRKKGGLKPAAPRFPANKPDLSKLVRALEDALTGIVYDDDARIVIHKIDKLYAGQSLSPRAVVTVIQLPEKEEAHVALG